MFLRKAKLNGRIHLSCVKGYRDKNGKNKNKTIKTFGYVDVLEKNYEDPIKHFEEVVKQMDDEEKSQNAPINIKLFPKRKINKRLANQLDLGAAIPSKYFHYDLGLWTFFEKKRTARKIKVDPCRVLELLVWNRLTNPASKKKAWEEKDRFPRKCNFKLDDIYKSLTYYAENKDNIIKYINNTYEEKRGKRIKSNLYYDVTNYYFEIEEEDDFRMRGVSKEHRPNPIVQMGLLLDSDGLPLNFELFSGNTIDSQTLLPVMKKSGFRNKKEKVIMVADKGLNCSDNIAACILDHNGYIFSQSVRKAPKELKDWVLNDTDYKINKDQSFKIKSRQSFKTVYIEDENSKTKKVKVPVKEVAFWSKDYYLRSRHEREKIIEKSKKAIARNYFPASKAHSSIKYAKDNPVNKKTGEVASHNWTLDEKKIAQDEALDGYYCIVTSEINMDDKEIIDNYRGLWVIEESFKVTKSDLKARPVFVSTKDHITAHFLICYIALFIMRLIQLDTRNNYSAKEISTALKNIVGHRIDTNYFYFDYRTDITDEFSMLIDKRLQLEVLTKAQINDIMSKVKNM